MKVGLVYEITLKNGLELYGYTVYKKKRVSFGCLSLSESMYTVGYDGLDGHEDFRREILASDIKSSTVVV